MFTKFKILPLLAAALTVFITYAPAKAQETSRSRSRSAGDGTVNAENARRQKLIENRIVTRLAKSGSLAGSDVRVRIDGNTVVLDGLVGDQHGKDRAAQIAKRVRGVENVRNEIRIDADAVNKNRSVDVTDDELSKQIAEKLVRDLFPNARAERDWAFGWEVEGDNWEFEVDVDGGDIRLSGDVPRTAAISEILQKVRSVPGVRSIESYLRSNNREYHYGPYAYGPEGGYLHAHPIL